MRGVEEILSVARAHRHLRTLDRVLTKLELMASWGLGYQIPTQDYTFISGYLVAGFSSKAFDDLVHWY
jgi:hypothetical protein